MKKYKTLIPFIALAGLTTAVTPLTLLTSCGKKTGGNLMTEYTPTIGIRERKTYDSPSDVVDTYLRAVNDNHSIFAQDLQYTLSRGMPEYMSYISRYCEVGDNNFNMDIDPSSITVTMSDNGNEKIRQISFDLTMDLLFDYSGTKKEEMEFYDMYVYRWDTTTKVRMVFDFAVPGPEYSEGAFPHEARKQMTTIAGATQLGISEVNSTIKILSEKGSYWDLNNIKHRIDVQEPEAESHPFILPNSVIYDDYDAYLDRYNDVAYLWFEHPGAQAIILILKYYMGESIFTRGSVTPNTLDFGSYYMGQATLKDPYAFQFDSSSKTATLFGFNMCLDSINNDENVRTSSAVKFDASTGTLTLPETILNAGQQYTVNSIYDNAFNGAQTNYTNLGLTHSVNRLVIPKSITSIGGSSFCSNNILKRITFEHDATEGAPYPSASANAFASLTSVKEIDFSQFKTSEIDTFKASKMDEAFTTIHMGIKETSNIYGYIKLPEDYETKLADWKLFLTNCGFPLHDGTNDGWQIVTELPS